jgi:2-methylisocitrate lyase-like PEP mutase family enzyme/ribosomal protein S18 acetylase RimI-like enzyme
LQPGIARDDCPHEQIALARPPELQQHRLMTLRPATPADAPAMAALAARAYGRWTTLIGIAPTPAVADYGALTRPASGAECWVLPGPNGLEASLVFEITPAAFELFSIAVAPEAQAAGLGRKLMDFAERRAREKGFREISLYTNIRMVANRAFYRRLGYEETGRLHIRGRQAATMTKRLDGTRMTPMTDDMYAARRAAYRKLHAEGCFVQPNPWDAGTARWLRAKGFPAMATTSAGFAWTRGRPDQDVPLDMMLGYIADMVEAVPDLPVNADFENGYARDEETLARNIGLCAATGVAGLSIEDATGDPADPLYDFETALRRFTVARKAIDATGADIMLTARAEAYLHGHPDPLREVCKRLAAFADAGADVLYAPGPTTAAQMREVIAAAGGKPVNIIVFADIGMSVDDIAKLGARRISIGSALAKAAWTGFVAATEELAKGSFAGFRHAMPSGPLNQFFAADMTERGLQ